MTLELMLGMGQPLMAQPDGSAADQRGARFLAAAAEAQQKLQSALSGNDIEAAEAAAREMAAALAAYEAFAGDELVVRIDELAGMLASAPASEAVRLETSLQSLEAVIDGLRSADAGIERLATRLAGLIAATGPPRGNALTSLLALARSIVEKGRFADAGAIAESVGGMVALVLPNTAETAFRPPWEQPKFADEVTKAHRQIDAGVASHLPVKWFTDVAAAIGTRAGGADENARKATAPTRVLLQNSVGAMEAAKKAKVAIDLLEGGYRPRIHVIEALHGDLQAGRRSSRVCDATRAMIARCEGKASCTLPDNYHETLCGYDPVPAAAAHVRAVAVQFSCHVGGDALWDELARYPFRDPANHSDLLSLDNPAVSTALLRGTVMDMRCPSEPYAAIGGK